FKPLDHQTVGENLGALDLATAAKLSGSRFALWKGGGAKLLRALGNFLLDRHAAKGYVEVHPPYLVRPEVMEGTSQLPKFEADMYKT
ncbi:serine--tRNA ligase, partial [Pseudomonas sp. GW456-12-10-14-LB2]